MKRLLAALLTLSMLVGIVPFSAFAESPGTVPETFAAAQESPGLDDETVQSIVSDPLLQGQYAPPQQAQPTVDTSNMSMEATDSFGKLLVNSIDSQNSASSSENRVIGVTVDGNTATVEYVAAEDADLVVGIYTDNSAKEMVASGTTSVLATVETSSSSFATVNISGTIPEYYTVKCYLLDKTEHAPLSEVYANESYTQAMVDLNTATVDDFPADRVINFDDDSSTNFAVVKSNIVFITPDTTSDAENTVTQKDNENLVYTITNATDAITNLHSGNILTLEDTQGSLLIVRVASITVNGDSVTIQGDDTLEITDVFDVLKIEESAESGELIHSDEDMDEAVTYLGVRENIDSENSFQIKDGGITDNIPLLDDSLHEFNVSGTVNDMKDGMLSATVKGKLLLKANIDFAYYISLNNQWLALSSDISVSGDLSVSGAITGKVPLGHLHTPDFLEDKFGVKAEITPNLVLELSAKFAFKYSYAQNIIWKYSTSNGFQNLSKSAEGKIEPVVKDGKDTTDTISIFAGLEVGPKIKLNDELLWLEFKLKGGITTTAERLASDDEMRHECAQCLDFTETVNGKFTITLIIFKTDYSKFGIPKEIKLLDIPIGNWYWSLTFGEFGEGTCPHIAYRVTISLDGSKESGITIYEKKSNGTHYEFTELGQTDETGILKTYLASGSYDLTASIGKQNYSAVTTVYDAATEVELSPERSEQPSQPEDTPDYTIENGRLTINTERVMLDYASASDTPWYNSRDEITYILTQYMVKKISSYAFADCNKVTTVQIGDDITEIGDYAFSGCTSLEKVIFAGTMAKWKEVQIGVGNDILKKANIICSDGTIEGDNSGESGKPEDTIVASGKCGDTVFWMLNQSGKLTIWGYGKMATYSAHHSAPWDNFSSKIKAIEIQNSVTSIGGFMFGHCTELTSVTIPSSVTEIGVSAFEGCIKLKDIILSDGITEIGNYAFRDCSSLTNITIPSTVTKIASWTFSDCTALTNVIISSGVQEVERHAFDCCSSLTSVLIPTSVVVIGQFAFYNCPNLEISYEGTISQWNALTKYSYLFYVIHCSDGDILPTATSKLSFEENSIFPSTATGDDHGFAASFSDLTPGVSYAVIVSRSESDPLAPENLIYINQFRASSSDYQQSFQTPRSSALTADDMAYVIASGIYSFDETPTPTPTPTPGGGSSSGGGSGGGGGGGAAVLIGVGAAAAITAGVIMMSPVEIKGRVVLTDQAAVPGAKISLLREGKVVAQTTADENGSFSLKAKRGSYELTAAYTTADGQLIYKTIDIKAPAKDLTVTF